MRTAITRSPARKPRVGISSCLLGQPVRYDGGHKRAPSIIDTLGPLVEWVPVCPELDIGLGVPRPAIDLHVVDGELRLLMPSTGRDLTADMQRYAARKVDELRSLDLAGYILKSKSPSCGLGSTNVHDETGEVIDRAGTGAFAAVLKAHFPELPVAEETALAGSERLKQFMAAVLARHSLK